MSLFSYHLKKFIHFNAMTVFVCLVYTNLAPAAPSSEIQALTVAFLYNFMKLSEWPSDGANGELTLCITKPGDLAAELDSLQGKGTQSKTINIKHLVQGDKANECQLLFKPNEEKPIRMIEWLKTTENMPVLTVSDMDKFLDQGGMIALVNDGNRLQFEVNLALVQRAGIKLSSKMLQIAREVRGNE